MAAVRVILAEPSALIRSLLRVALSSGGAAVVGETTSVIEMLELVDTERPDVVIANCVLRDGDLDPHLAGLASSGVRVLVLARDASPERLTGLLVGGAFGYLLHDSAPDSIVEAVEAVARGDIALHPIAASVIVDQWRRLRGDTGRSNERLELTPREVEVLSAMVDGLSNKAIARRLGVAVKTIENHKTRVFDKLGVRTQAHAVGLAISQGLLATLEPAAAGTPAPVGGN